MSGDQEILVVGGGVFGAAGALELQKRGREVALVDVGPLPHPAASSTDISKVIRMDYGADEFYMEVMERALAGWRAWNEGWQRPLFHEVGFLLLSHEEMVPGTFEGDSYALLRERGHVPQRLGREALAGQFPAWAEGGHVDGYYNPEAGWVEAGQVVRELIHACRSEGVAIHEGRRVTELRRRGSRVTGVQTERGPLEAQWVMLASGAWTPALLPKLADKVWSVGQPVIHFKVPEPERFQPPEFLPWASDIARSGWYGFPALADGTLKMANHGPGKALPPSGTADVHSEQVEAFRRFLGECLPPLVHAPILHSRLCFYADSWDGDLYIDRVPGQPGLVVATGGSGHGFKFAPLLGNWIADALEGRDNPDLHRFAWRDRGARRTEEARYT